MLHYELVCYASKFLQSQIAALKFLLAVNS